MMAAVCENRPMARISSAPAIGLDFGTTNSSIAWSRSGDAQGAVTLAQFSTAVGPTASFRSLLFFEQDAQRRRHSYAGPTAIERYLAAEDHRGRLMQSLKSYLAARTLTGTEVFGQRYALEDLLSRILRQLRTDAGRSLGVAIERAVVGRPVHFVGAETAEDDAFAEARLRDACMRAGFAEVTFAYEPVGAALAYEATLDHEEMALIGDFGGGTSDFSLLRLGPGEHSATGAERILGTSGVGLAGDAFDAKLVRHLVSPALGDGTMERSGSKLLPAVPAWIYTNLERWHHLSFLRTRNVTEMLKGARVRALEPEKIEALQWLIQEDLGFQLHAAVQRVKYALSQELEAEFVFNESGLHLRIPVERAQFEGWIGEELAAIEGAVDGLLAGTGVAAGEIDRVFLTGGTSFVPAVERIFTERFDVERVRRGEAFTAVAHGLALEAARMG
jgi:hypothetical chaperone protein